MESLLVRIERLLDGERGKKTSLAQLRRTVYERCFRGKRKQWLHALPEIAVLLAAISAITYVYGPNMVETFGYKASDIPVHNYWINELERNNICVAGVYPYGFHIVIYYLHMVFGIPTYVLLRIFGVRYRRILCIWHRRGAENGVQGKVYAVFWDTVLCDGYLQPEYVRPF